MEAVPREHILLLSLPSPCKAAVLTPPEPALKMAEVQGAGVARAAPFCVSGTPRERATRSAGALHQYFTTLRSSKTQTGF